MWRGSTASAVGPVSSQFVPHCSVKVFVSCEYSSVDLLSVLDAVVDFRVIGEKILVGPAASPYVCKCVRVSALAPAPATKVCRECELAAKSASCQELDPRQVGHEHLGTDILVPS